MDEQKTPEDILDEIMNRTPKSSPRPTSYPPEFEPPPPEDIPLPPLKVPEKTERPDWAAKLLPWLCVLLGAALLVLGVCVLQMNYRLDRLQQAVEGVAEIDRLREENEALQAEVDAAHSAQAEAEQDIEHFREGRDDAIQQLNVTTIQKWRSDYLFYIGQFMDSGDYPMAAMAAALSANRYFSTAAGLADVPYNPAQEAQYQTYRQELLDRGYLQELTPETFLFGETNFEFAEQYDPSKDPDMAALAILWCAIEGYYVKNNTEMATQYLINYQFTPLGDLGSKGDAYPQRLRESAQAGTLELYEQLIRDLVGSGSVVEEKGVLSYAPDSTHTDILYDLPFDPPVNYAYIPLG